MKKRVTNKMRQFILFFLLGILLAGMLTGCAGASTNTVEGVYLSNSQTDDKETIEKGDNQEYFAAGETVYGNVYFIESPLGMKYTGNWYLDNALISTSEKEMLTDKAGAISYELDMEKAVAGNWKFEICYKDEVLYSGEFVIQ